MFSVDQAVVGVTVSLAFVTVKLDAMVKTVNTSVLDFHMGLVV